MHTGFLPRLLAEVLGRDEPPQVLALTADATAEVGISVPSAGALPQALQDQAADTVPGLFDRITRLRADENVLVVVPWIRASDLPESIQPRVDGVPRRTDLQELVTALALDRLDAGTLVTVLASPSFVDTPMRTSLVTIRRRSAPTLILDGGRRVADAFGFHPLFHPMLLQMRVLGEPAATGPSPVRFAELDRLADETDDEVLAELQRLLRAEGGSGRLGWILRQEIPCDAPLRPAYHAPERRDRHNQLRRVGDLVPLGDLVEPIPSVRRDLPGPDPKQEVRLLEGRAIDRDAHVDLSQTRTATGALPGTAPLAPGDLCFRAITRDTDAKFVVCARFPEDDGEPVWPTQSVVALRFREGVDPTTQEVVSAFLVSPHADALLRGAFSGLHLTARHLTVLDVPLPDVTLRTTLEALHDDQRRLESWAAEARQARRSLLQGDNIVRSLLEVEETGRLVRQRVAAARRMDDLSGRVQQFMPFPLALMWRAVSTSRPDDAGYLHILQCAEAVACYLASMSVLFARAAGVEQLGQVKSVRDALRRGGHGVSMGDWSAIAAAAATCKTPEPVDEKTPFVEMREAMAEAGEAMEALGLLTERRNAHAHGRGPRGAAVVAEAFHDAHGELSRLYRSLEWLVRYPLRLVETTVWDSARRTCTVGYRDLVGDHHLVPLQLEQRPMAEIDGQRLHCVDQFGDLHLIDPLLTLRVCDQCHIPSVFALNMWDRDTDVSTLRALDHNHVVEDLDASERLRAFGFLPEPRVPSE